MGRKAYKRQKLTSATMLENLVGMIKRGSKAVIVATVIGGLASMLYMGCKKADGVTPYDPIQPPVNTPTPCVSGELAYENVTLFDPGDGRPSVRGNVVINNQQEYDDFFNSLPDFPPGNPTPISVDWSRKTLIGVIRGTCADSCYFTEISEIETDCETMTVSINEYEKHDCPVGCFQLSSHPNDFVLIGKSDLPVDFVYVDSDIDGDGFSDQIEIGAGTDKCDSNDHP